MPLPANSEAANIALLMNLLAQPGNQKSLLQKWKESGHKHQLAICFTFPKDFQIHLKQGVKQPSAYAERVMRLCESINQPDTIKADIWTRTLNNGIMAGIQPGVTVGDPITPELFFQKIGYVLVAYVQQPHSSGGGLTSPWLLDAIPVSTNGPAETKQDMYDQFINSQKAVVLEDQEAELFD